jgi:cell division protease FtsH
MGLQRKSLVLDDQDVNLIAVHEAGHAVVATLTKASDPVHQATIIPRGAALGLVMRLPERDRFSVPLSKLYADLDVAMAGRAAEEIVLGKENVTTGASGDIEQATSLAKKMVTEWGMSDVIGMVRAVDNNGKPTAAAEPEIRRLIDDAYGRAKLLLETNRDGLDRLVQALLEKKTLDGIEVAEIVTGACSAPRSE